MKKQLLAIFCFLLTSISYAQLLNPGFENLRPDGKPAHWGSITLLAFGDTDQICKIDSGFYFTSKDAHTGKYAMEMRNADCLGIIIGGAHAMSVDSTYFAAGIPFSDRPAYFTFWYKFNSIGNDTAAAHIWMYNDISGNTLIDEWIYLPNSPNYSPISLPLNYALSESPSQVEISFSTETDRSQAHYGSRLVVDDLEMRNAALKIEKTNPLVVNCYPNPTKNTVQFTINNVGSHRLELFNIGGQKMMETKMISNYQLNCTDLSKGLYLYSITSETGLKTQGKLIVE